MYHPFTQITHTNVAEKWIIGSNSAESIHVAFVLFLLWLLSAELGPIINWLFLKYLNKFFFVHRP